MKKKFNTFLIFLLFFIAVVFTTGCSPIGSLLVAPSPKTVAYDYIRAVPNKFLYGNNGRFIPANDVEVFGVFGGEDTLIFGREETRLHDDGVEFKIYYNEEWTDEPFDDEVPDKTAGVGFRVTSVGILRIEISYKDMKTYYHIQVGEPGTGSGSGWPNGQINGIEIIWK